MLIPVITHHSHPVIDQRPHCFFLFNPFGVPVPTVPLALSSPLSLAIDTANINNRGLSEHAHGENVQGQNGMDI